MSSPTTPNSFLTDEPLTNPAEKKGKVVNDVPIPLFICFVLCLPIWATTVLPLSIIYQLGKVIFSYIGSKIQQYLQTAEKQHVTNKKTNNFSDSGYVVDPSLLVPREKRKYDIVVLGASGLTGSLAVRYLLKTYGCGDGAGGTPKDTSKKTTVKWAIAGRSKEKLTRVLRQVGVEFNQYEKVLKNIDILEVDTKVPSTLPRLVQQTKVVANTAGPYALLGGSNVIEFCAKFGTHYVDITGEVTWVKTMMNQWQSTAQQTGSVLIPFCGHDSIPWDLSVYKMREYLKLRQLDEKENDDAGDTLSKATFWDVTKGSAGSGTLNTLISIVKGQQPEEPKSDPFMVQTLPSSSSSSSLSPKLVRNLPGLVRAIELPQSPFYSTSATERTIPFVMADVNAEIVRWSHMLYCTAMNKLDGRKEREEIMDGSKNNNKMVYRETLVVPNFHTGFVMHVGMIVLISFFLNPITLVLFQFFIMPRVNQQSPIKDMETKHFLTVLGEGVGRRRGKNKNDGIRKVQTLFYIDQNAGIMVTSHMMIEAGLCLALQFDDLPLHQLQQKEKVEGGFYPPAMALGNILLERLTNFTNITFQARIITDKSTIETTSSSSS